MHRRTVARAAGAAAFVAALGSAVALPATAAPDTPNTPVTQLQTLQQDLGLSAEQAQLRLTQEAAAPATEQAARTAVGTAFAGSWFDGSGLVVAISDAAMADEVRTAGAEPQVVQHDAATLSANKSELDARAESVPDSVTSWHVDPRTNSVVVSATDAQAAETFAAGVEGVRVETVADRPEPLAIIGGEAITNSGGRCSVGFSATDGASGFVVTAGHCTEGGGTWTAEDGTTIGAVSSSSFPDNDYGVIENTGGSALTGTVSDYAGGTIAITGSTEVGVGASVCRSGSTTGYQCGEVEALDQTVNYGDGDVVNGLTQTTACAEPGDSGGSFISGDQAQGMTSGGSGDCSSGGTTFFQPVNEALSANGLTLVTG